MFSRIYLLSLALICLCQLTLGFTLEQAKGQSPTTGQAPLGQKPQFNTPQIQGQIEPANQAGQIAGQDKAEAISITAEAGAEFDQEFAFQHLKNVCEIGGRVSTSPGMQKQQTYLAKHFQAIGAEVKLQPFNVRDPRTGAFVRLDNLIARFHPERTKRLLFCCHYDTRPYPDRDRRDPMGLFIGANDGGSGVGALCELGRHIQSMEGNYGIDVIFFDGEEFVFVARRDPMFLGSNFFSNEYAAGRYDAVYEYAVLVDMIGDKKLQLKMEVNSLNYAGRLTRSIWGVAKQLKVKEFVPRKGHTIRDDHLPLNMIARIQTCDIIDFDYPTPQSKNAFWHTTKDTVENCSADSLGKVGKVLLEWIRQMQKLNGGQ